MSLYYLWKNRVKYRMLTFSWSKQWAKRAINAKSLTDILWKRKILELSGTQIGENSVISKSASIDGSLAKLEVGEYSFIGEINLSIHAKVTVGSRVVINDGVKIITATHDTNSPEWASVAKPIRIDNYAWIASNAILLPGVHIGEAAIVGAGAVVSKDVEKYNIVVGNPACALANKRVAELNFNPVRRIACYEAWLGKENT